MRRILALVAFAVSVAAAAVAAAPDLVVHAGMATATIHQDDLASDAREGLAGGVGARVHLDEGFWLLPEVWYLQKGFQGGTLAEEIEFEGKLQTISVPILVSYWFTAKHLDSRVFGGIAADFVLKSEIRRDPDPGWLDTTARDESLYWSLVVGGGARFDRLDLEVRYQHGLTRVTDFDYPEFDDVFSQMFQYDDAYDRTWVLSLGYWF